MSSSLDSGHKWVFGSFTPAHYIFYLVRALNMHERLFIFEEVFFFIQKQYYCLFTRWTRNIENSAVENGSNIDNFAACQLSYEGTVTVYTSSGMSLAVILSSNYLKLFSVKISDGHKKERKGPVHFRKDENEYLVLCLKWQQSRNNGFRWSILKAKLFHRFTGRTGGST